MRVYHLLKMNILAKFAITMKKNYLLSAAKEDHLYDELDNKDKTKILEFLLLTYFMKIAKLTVMIISFTYFIAMFWLIYIIGMDEFVLDVDIPTLAENKDGEFTNFMLYYNLFDKSFS
jgi:hypothetical protein